MTSAVKPKLDQNIKRTKTINNKREGQRPFFFCSSHTSFFYFVMIFRVLAKGMTWQLFIISNQVESCCQIRKPTQKIMYNDWHFFFLPSFLDFCSSVIQSGAHALLKDLLAFLTQQRRWINGDKLECVEQVPFFTLQDFNLGPYIFCSIKETAGGISNFLCCCWCGSIVWGVMMEVSALESTHQQHTCFSGRYRHTHSM